MSCPVCHRSIAKVGVLCEECHEDLLGLDAVVSEQVIFHDSQQPTKAAVIDLWGRPYRLGVDVVIGRELGGVQILDQSVSRKHARITLENGTWVLRDLSSTNGTFADDVPVREPTELDTGARIRVGPVAFYFLDDAMSLPPRRFRRPESETRRSQALPQSSTTEISAQPRWIPSSSIVLSEPTGGGGCIAELDGKRIQLTLPQYELISTLLSRAADDIDEDESSRGFVSMPDLVARISLDSSEANVRQLVRRVRRALQRAGIPDLIESKPGRGYRLRVKPHVK